MAVKLTCTDNASGHDGLRWRMGPDAQSVTTLVGETAPGVGELVVAEPITPEACFSVASYSGGDESAAAAVCAYTLPPHDFSTATIGDEIGGGIYAGIDTINGTDYYIVSGKDESEAYGLSWDESQRGTPGADSETDGLANTQAMEAVGIDAHHAAKHCVNYAGGGHNDWHMPARSQITLMYNNLAGHAEFATNVGSGHYTWASTQVSGATWQGWARRFSDGNEAGYGKASTSIRVRPVRRVAV